MRMPYKKGEAEKRGQPGEEMSQDLERKFLQVIEEDRAIEVALGWNRLKKKKSESGGQNDIQQQGGRF